MRPIPSSPDIELILSVHKKTAPTHMRSARLVVLLSGKKLYGQSTESVEELTPTMELRSCMACHPGQTLLGETVPG